MGAFYSNNNIGDSSGSDEEIAGPGANVIMELVIADTISAQSSVDPYQSAASILSRSLSLTHSRCSDDVTSTSLAPSPIIRDGTLDSHGSNTNYL